MILITGGNGFIGKNLVNKLGAQAVAWDIKFGRDIFSNEIEPWVAKSEAIVHLAAITSHDRSVAEPELTRYINVNGTLKILLLAEQYKKKVIFASTAAIYRDTGRNSYRETDELGSETPYGQSKIDAEYLCGAFRRVVPITTLRFFNVYGYGQNPDYAGVITKFLEQMKQGALSIYGDGTQTRDFIYIDDVVDILIEAIKNKEWEGKIVNVGTGKATTINQLYGIFKRNNRKVKSPAYLPAKQEIRYSVADTLNLRTIYHKELKTNLAEDLEKMIKELK